MAKILVQDLVPMLLLVLVAVAGATPPGIANNPSHATCTIKKYKHCYNLVHVCPKFCPDGCTVECASCKPICVGGANPPPDNSPTPSTPSTPEHPPSSPSPSTPSTPSTPENPPPSIPSPENPPSTPSTPKENPPPTTPTPENPTPSPPSTPSTPENPPPSPSTPSSPENPTPSPSVPSTPENPPPSIPSPENPPSTPSTPEENPPPTTPTPENPTPSPPSTPSTPSSPENPTPSPSIPSTPENPPPSPSTPSSPENSPPSTPSTPQNPSPATPSPSTPENSPPTSSTPPSSPTPSSPSTPSSPKTARCRNKNYPKCYNMEHVCPSACPGGCGVDCYTCKPVCKCDKPGAVCQDPRFIGGDGITFYFHGKKDTNFCLVSDPNLHINAHFIGRRNHNMNRDFTWVQSIAILFDNHQLFIGAHKTATWDDSVDRLALSLDGEPITLAQSEGAAWQSPIGGVSIARDAGTNSVSVEVEGKLKVTAKVVPITEQDSRVHKYGITSEDCFAHLDLGFKFMSLSNEVSGVLGQTYRTNYVRRVDIGVKMPVMGGGDGAVREFQTSDLFSTDCSVARFVGNSNDNGIATMEGFEIPGLSCASASASGVVCKR